MDQFIIFTAKTISQTIGEFLKEKNWHCLYRVYIFKAHRRKDGFQGQNLLAYMFVFRGRNRGSELYWKTLRSIDFYRNNSLIHTSNNSTCHVRAFWFRHLGPSLYIKNQVSNGAKIRNRYNQVPHLTQGTNGEVTK